MTAYIVRRLLMMLIVLVGVSIVVFGLIHITPGDPARIMLGPAARDEDVQRLRVQFGLDQPVYAQYVPLAGEHAPGQAG